MLTNRDCYIVTDNLCCQSGPVSSSWQYYSVFQDYFQVRPANILTFTVISSPGLNLGLMSLDQTELKIVMSTGTEKEQDYANVSNRRHGYTLLILYGTLESVKGILKKFLVFSQNFD